MNVYIALDTRKKCGKHKKSSEKHTHIREKINKHTQKNDESNGEVVAENLLLIGCASSVDGSHIKWHRKLACEQLCYARTFFSKLAAVKSQNIRKIRHEWKKLYSHSCYDVVIF